MRFPHPAESGIAFILYAFLIFIAGMGVWQFVRTRYLADTSKPRSLVPLGAAAAAFGLIGLYGQWSEAFEAIEMAEDISPAIVAGALRNGVSYPTFGFLIFAISLVFRFVNSR